MGSDWYEDVLAFHEKFGSLILEEPAVPTLHTRELRRTLVKEEIREFFEALDNSDIVKLADSIADAIVVLLGTAVSFGIDMRPIWNLVHEANMRKDGGGKRHDGKVLKPVGWVPPDIEGEIRRQQGED